jgi:hypothetical protein
MSKPCFRSAASCEHCDPREQRTGAHAELEAGGVAAGLLADLVGELEEALVLLAGAANARGHQAASPPSKESVVAVRDRAARREGLGEKWKRTQSGRRRGAEWCSRCRGEHQLLAG